MRTSLQIFLSIVLSIFFVSDALAQTYTVESNGEYVMGDSDTKVEARKIALEHAKRLALEKIGTYLESETVVKSGQLTKDEIKVYTSGIIQTTVLSENMSLLEGKTTVFQISIRANVDTALLEKKIKEIVADTKRKNQIDSLQAENIKLLREVESLSVQLKSDKASEYSGLRQKRESLLEKLEKNHNSIRVAFEKGTLLNLALKSKDELEELKNYIDEAFQFMADNTIFTVGEPQVRYKGERADLVIDVTWRIDKLNDVINRLTLFYSNLTISNIKRINSGEFKGINARALSAYYEGKTLLLKIEAGQRAVFVNIKDIHAINTEGRERLIINDIPINNLTDITSINAKVVTK